MLAKKQPLRQREVISVFYNKQPTYNPVPYLKNTKGLLSNKNIGRHHTTETLAGSKLITSDNLKSFGYPRTLLTQIPVINNLSKDNYTMSEQMPTREFFEVFERAFYVLFDLSKKFPDLRRMAFTGGYPKIHTFYTVLIKNRGFLDLLSKHGFSVDDVAMKKHKGFFVLRRD